MLLSYLSQPSWGKWSPLLVQAHFENSLLDTREKTQSRHLALKCPQAEETGDG